MAHYLDLIEEESEARTDRVSRIASLGRLEEKLRVNIHRSHADFLELHAGRQDATGRPST